jgi:hypothetical protein
MKIPRHPIWLFLALLSVSCVAGEAQRTSLPDPGFQRLGRIKPRAAKDIASSSWSIGGETLDRDFGIYANYKAFLGPLGAKAIRLQTGWAKCETKPGVYDFAWLDEVVNDARSQGVQPWLEVSYGNRLYPDGGGTGLGGALPKSSQALTAWDNWVRAVVRRYQDRVNEWEVWNEPDLGPSSAEEYAEFFIRTAEVIRSEQPKARIYALALAHKVAYAKSFLARVHQRGKLALIDAITVHSYPTNPDDTRNIDELRAIIVGHGHPITVRQGETGATSKFQENFALKKLPMTETIQAKWNLRRMLAHHGKDVPFNLFTMIDLHYRWNGKVDMNYKGLLASREDQTVAYAKPAYFAAQKVFAIFDNSLVRLTNFTCTASVTNSIAAFAYTNRITGAQVVALWFKDDMPSGSNNKTLVDFRLSASHFKEPAYVDLLTGQVYALRSSEKGTTFKQIPLYDSPILIAEKAVLPLDTQGTPNTAELIFQSGFEDNCEIVPLGASQHDLIGQDTTLREKNDWVEDLEKRAGIKMFRFDYTGGDISQRFVRIVPEPSNPTNRVLWFWLNDSWKADGGVVKARVQADIYGVKEGLKEFYQSVRVFLPEDWNVVRRYPHPIHWCTISEFWNDVYWPNNPKGFRVTLGIGKPSAPTGDLYFLLDAQGPEMRRVWIAHNEQVKVPIGRWFTLDCYFKEGDSQNGRFYVAVTPDGQARQVVYDVLGWTRNTTNPTPDGITDWNPMKLYTSKELVAFVKSQGKTLQIYWDDFRLWKNRQPVDSTPSPPKS